MDRHFEAKYKPSGKTTGRAVALMAASVVPAGLAGALVFGVVVLLCSVTWALSELTGWGAAGFFKTAGECWQKWLPVRTLIALVITLLLYLLKWLFYLAGPILALCAPLALGRTIGCLVVWAGRQGNNRNRALAASVAGLAALVTELACTAVVFPGLTSILFGPDVTPPKWLTLRLEEIFFNSTILAWLIAGVGILLGVGFAAWTAIEQVNRAIFCKPCKQYCRQFDSPRFDLARRRDVIAVLSTRAFREPGKWNNYGAYDPYCCLTLHQCPGCGEGFLVATASLEGEIGSITVTREEAEQVKAAIKRKASPVLPDAKSGPEALAAVFNQLDEKGAHNFANLLNQMGEATTSEVESPSPPAPQRAATPGPEGPMLDKEDARGTGNTG